MDRTRLDLRFHHYSGSTQSGESALDLERNYCGHHPNLPSVSPSALQPFASSGQHSESNAAYFSWPTLGQLSDAAEDRANYFGNLQKEDLPETLGRLPSGQQATTLLELMTIRAFHSKILRLFSLGTAIGFRIRRGVLTDIPAILVFVARKAHREWLNHVQCLPAALEGPGGVWCDVDVVEFSYYGSPVSTPKEQLYTELADGLRGSDPWIGSGSQVASQETYGTLGAIVKSRTGNRQVGFLTNRHVAVDLDYPNQKMFHPLPPSLGPGVYLGAVERATSFITDDLWYGIFAGTNPETFVRADGAFIPFAEDFNLNNVITTVRGIGEIGDVYTIDLQSPINSLIGRQVMKVGISSGLTTGTIMAYALEYNDEKGICFFTDFLVVGENQQSFDLEGDSGSLILLTGQNGEKPRPVGIIWGGTANRGRLKLKIGQPPENWTSGVDLGRLLQLLELDLITTKEGFQAAIQEQRNASAAGIGSTVGESSPAVRPSCKDKLEDDYGPLGFNLQKIPIEGESCQGLIRPFMRGDFHIENCVETAPNIEHQFIPSATSRSPGNQNKQEGNQVPKNLLPLQSSLDEEVSVSLQLGEPEPKRRKNCNSLFSSKGPV
ncbi:protein NARROW LEAF 1 [Pyrus x bretschneideri]|uniref:protein NARROW LEAF 1 n=1 Tax=Pyrus x bretschneideri TaxID=225117 RepID=UPI00202EA3F3|nr:protein NARROW LEAF 1 [Pyrus x bretschneideri]XP_009376381.2 protein NARROW LEAF 1 [Pyrus x bretschneideri]